MSKLPVNRGTANEHIYFMVSSLLFRDNQTMRNCTEEQSGTVLKTK